MTVAVLAVGLLAVSGVGLYYRACLLQAEDLIDEIIEDLQSKTEA